VDGPGIWNLRSLGLGSKILVSHQGMVKHTVVHLLVIILSVIKGVHTSDIYNTLDKTAGNYADWKKPVPKDYRLYDDLI
jgi:hypothetical protein